MSRLVPLLWFAGALQVLIASANLFAVRMFRYREGLAGVSPIIWEVFIVQNVFIVLAVLGMAGLCFAFAPDLAGGSALGRYLSGFLSFFWTVRLGIQLVFYDSELRRRYRVFDVLFTASFVYLAVVFAIGALGR